MKRYNLLTALLCLQGGMALTAAAQPSIVAAEYFFDADPGIGGGTPIPVPSPASTVNLTATIPTTSLTQGFHFLGVRGRNASGQWSLFESRGVYIASAASSSGAVTAAEFFIDSDPGLGAATPMSIGTAGTTVNFSAAIPTTALSPGFHFLAIRTRDAAGRWGLFDQRGFYVTSSTASSGAITAAEYFIDSDSGHGAGVPLAIGASGVQVTFAASIPTTSLAPGFHFLAIRTRDAAGRWSLFEKRGFFISTAPSATPAITAAEYFIDSDPGLGAGTLLTVGAPGNPNNFIASIPTTSLSTGFHTLAIRVQDAAGKWGLFEQRMFYIMNAAGASSPIVRGEYFLDTDPGIGAGTPFTYATPALVQTDPVEAGIPPGTIAGPHVLMLRVQDNAGRWSAIDTAQFTVTSVPLTATDLRFGAQRAGGHSLLQWSAIEQPALKEYRIERGADGKSFEEIGAQEAIGAGAVQEYRFTDAVPLRGPNYYRLRTLDKDGSEGFSPVAMIMYGDDAAVAILPNPARNTVRLTGIDTKAELRIFSAEGKLAAAFNVEAGAAMDVSGLAAGTYWAEILSGSKTVRLPFVKQ